MPEQIFIELTDGVITKGRKSLANLFKGLSGRFTISIEKTKRKRSDQSNKYYWSCVVEDERACIKEMWGEIWSKNDVHTFNKVYFFGEEKVNQLTGEVIKVPKSSITSQDNFSEAIEKIKQFFFLQFNYRIREPKEQAEIFS